jgi:hypothetical protein
MIRQALLACLLCLLCSRSSAPGSGPAAWPASAARPSSIGAKVYDGGADPRREGVALGDLFEVYP